MSLTRGVPHARVQRRAALLRVVRGAVEDVGVVEDGLASYAVSMSGSRPGRGGIYMRVRFKVCKEQGSQRATRLTNR